MNLEENVRNRFSELIRSSNELKIGNQFGQILDASHQQECRAWLASAQNLVHFVIGDSSNPYKTRIDAVCVEPHGLMIPEAVGSVSAMLRALLRDIDNGLVSSIENQTRAAVFDDFLDHARAYAKRKLPRESGTIVGVVFEDTMRTLCRIHNIDEKNEKMDTLISELSRMGLLTAIKAKRARAAANVRTKATHAQWDEFDISDVRSTIEFTEELISSVLAR